MSQTCFESETATPLRGKADETNRSSSLRFTPLRSAVIARKARSDNDRGEVLSRLTVNRLHN